MNGRNGLAGRYWTIAAKAAMQTALDAAGGPLSTSELREVVPWRRERTEFCSGVSWHEEDDDYALVSCQPQVHVFDIPASSQHITRALNQLVRAGHVEKIRVPGHRELLWLSTRPLDLDAELAVLLGGAT